MRLSEAAHRAAIATLACAIAALAWAPARATSAPPGTVLARDAISHAVTDGHGAIAFAASPGKVRVIDDATGATSDTDVSAGCLKPPTVVPAINAGEVLFDCSVSHDTPYGRFAHDVPRLLDLATHTVVVPVGADEAVEEAEHRPLGEGFATGIGGRWLLLATPSYHAEGSIEVLDWHTGAQLSLPITATELLDVRQPTGVVSLCPPLRRKPYDTPDDLSGLGFDPYQYEAPYAIVYGPRTPLTLERCGSRRQLILQSLPRDGAPPGDAQLAAGFVTWQVGDALRLAYLPACDVRLSWRLDAESTDSLSYVSHLPNAIIVSQPHDRKLDGPWTLRRIPIDGACARTTTALSARVSAGGRRVAAAWRGGSVADAPSEASATLLGRSRMASPRLRVAAGAHAGVALGVPARRLRWRLGRGRWHAATGAAMRWALRAPVAHAAHTLTLDVHFAQGGSARFAVLLRPTRR
jgi:hypothetical protein